MRRSRKGSTVGSRFARTGLRGEKKGEEGFMDAEEERLEAAVKEAETTKPDEGEQGQKMANKKGRTKRKSGKDGKTNRKESMKRPRLRFDSLDETEFGRDGDCSWRVLATAQALRNGNKEGEIQEKVVRLALVLRANAALHLEETVASWREV